MRMSVSLALMAGLFAGSVRADALDDAIQREMARRQVPGVAVVVVKDGKIVREKGYGLANVEHGVPVTPDTVSARDLARWDMALDGDAILDARMKAASGTPPRLADGSSGPYGYGWYVGSQQGHRTILHGGAWQGFKTNITRYPDDRLTVIVLANSAAARQGKIADMVAAHYLPALAPVRAPAIADHDPATTTRARKAVAELLAGRVPEGLSEAERGRFHQRWVTQIAAEFREFGPLRSVELLAHSAEGSGRQARYRFLFENETLLVALHLGGDGSIERLGMSLE